MGVRSTIVPDALAMNRRRVDIVTVADGGSTTIGSGPNAVELHSFDQPHADDLLLIVAGGVAANRLLRARLGEAMAEIDGEVYYPRAEFCTDNGAMIAFTGLQYFKAGLYPDDQDPEFGVVEARARWSLEECSAG